MNHRKVVVVSHEHVNGVGIPWIEPIPDEHKQQCSAALVAIGITLPAPVPVPGRGYWRRKAMSAKSRKSWPDRLRSSSDMKRLKRTRVSWLRF